jgi:hypothetical protein
LGFERLAVSGHLLGLPCEYSPDLVEQPHRRGGSKPTADVPLLRNSSPHSLEDGIRWGQMPSMRRTTPPFAPSVSPLVDCPPPGQISKELTSTPAPHPLQSTRDLTVSARSAIILLGRPGVCLAAMSLRWFPRPKLLSDTLAAGRPDFTNALPRHALRCAVRWSAH